MPFPTLTTPRLQLRELKARDADALFAIHSDPETMRWFGADPLVDRHQALQLIEMFAEWRKAPAPGTRWGIVRQSDGDPRTEGRWAARRYRGAQGLGRSLPGGA